MHATREFETTGLVGRSLLLVCVSSLEPPWAALISRGDQCCYSSRGSNFKDMSELLQVEKLRSEKHSSKYLKRVDLVNGLSTFSIRSEIARLTQNDHNSTNKCNFRNIYPVSYPDTGSLSGL